MGYTMALSLEATGDEYYPSRVPFAFTRALDVGATGTCGPYRGRPMPYGSSTFELPGSVERGEEIVTFCQLVKPILPAMRAAGATEIHITFGYFHDGQCNFAYSAEEMRLLTDLGLDVWISTYGPDDG